MASIPPKNWRDKGYLLPDVIDPEENICVCIPIPKDWGHIRAFVGQMTELSKWLTWEKDGTDSGARAARRWFEITECVAQEIDCIMATGCGCGCDDDLPKQGRINPETGLYEVSTDGGLTWEVDRADDPRITGAIFPDTPGDPGAEKRCETANSVIGFLEGLQQQELANLEANATVADIITGLIGALSGIGLLFAFVPAAIVGLVAFVVNKFAHMIAMDFETEFTEATWDALLCVLYCQMGDDGSFTELQWQNIKIKCVEDVGGYAGYWLQDHINLIGIVGLTNAGRASYPGTRDCDACDCGLDLIYTTNPEMTVAGTVEYRGDNVWRVTSGIRVFEGVSQSQVQFEDANDLCFKVTDITEISGAATRFAYTPCGGGFSFGSFIDICIQGAAMDTGEPLPAHVAPFVADITAEICT